MAQKTVLPDEVTVGIAMAASTVQPHVGARPVAVETRRERRRAGITDSSDAPAPCSKRTGATSAVGGRHSKDRSGVPGACAGRVDGLRAGP